MKSGGATSSCVYVLSDEVDLLFVFTSRFYCVGADDGQVQAISGEVGKRNGSMDKRRKQGWLDTRIVR